MHEQQLHKIDNARLIPRIPDVLTPTPEHTYMYMYAAIGP